MNKSACDVLKALLETSYSNQRVLAQNCGHSLGAVNQALKELQSAGMIDENRQCTVKARAAALQQKPKRAVILAAGSGMRMVPINLEMPKGLLEVKGEPLIERLIRQLHAVEVTEIYVVVGFLKEKFEYLIDEFGVELIVNPDYARKNNLHSLALVADKLENCYVVPCDLWCRQNPFSKTELYNWYMVREETGHPSMARVSRWGELIPVAPDKDGNCIVGIAYLVGEPARTVAQLLPGMDMDMRYDNSYWEMVPDQMNWKHIWAKVVSMQDVVEINTYEQLREFNTDANQLSADALWLIQTQLGVSADEITRIEVVKKGLSNRSFSFVCRGKKYVIRVPEPEADELICRTAEAEVYRILSDAGISDKLIYLGTETGYKITEYLEGARSADPYNPDEVRQCMHLLRRVHGMGLKVSGCTEYFDGIAYFEKKSGQPSAYRDYQDTKQKVLRLKRFLQATADECVLCQLDTNQDNFLFVPDENGGQQLRLIDWEHAAMHDPLLDVVAFGTYTNYSKEQFDQLLEYYYDGEVTPLIRARAYAYIALLGLWTSNWCEYKQSTGIEFGAYSLLQYRYAKEYYRHAVEEIGKMEEENYASCETGGCAGGRIWNPDAPADTDNTEAAGAGKRTADH